MAQEQGYGEIDTLIWFDNVPHPKLVEYKKDQNWVRKSGDYLVFPGGGTQFKEGVTSYIKFIEKVVFRFSKSIYFVFVLQTKAKSILCLDYYFFSHYQQSFHLSEHPSKVGD